ncbi:MAG: isochorismatase family protein [Thermoplasmata archaeon]
MHEDLKIRPDDTIFIAINTGVENFKDISTKLEVVTAFEYIFDAARKRQIPTLFCRRKESLNMERGVNSAHVSSFDDEFFKRYKNVLSAFKDGYLAYDGLDAFTSRDIVNKIRLSGRSAVCIFGIPIEMDVIASVFGAIRLGWKPLVISDASSSVSERIFYESVDIMSRVVTIIDSRDLMKSWGDI